MGFLKTLKRMVTPPKVIRKAVSKLTAGGLGALAGAAASMVPGLGGLVNLAKGAVDKAKEVAQTFFTGAKGGGQAAANAEAPQALGGVSPALLLGAGVGAWLLFRRKGRVF